MEPLLLALLLAAQQPELRWGSDEGSRFAPERPAVTFESERTPRFDAGESFTVEVELRTTHAEFCTPLMARDGEAVNYSLVLGRRPGAISFEHWSWGRHKLIGSERVDDGRWHHVRAAWHAPSRHMALWIDGALQGLLSAPAGFRAAAGTRLRLGDNIGARQPFTGALRRLVVRPGHPEELDSALQLVNALRAFDPGEVDAAFEAWLVRRRARLLPEREDAARAEAQAARVRAHVQDSLGLWPPPHPADPELRRALARAHGAVRTGGARAIEATDFAHYETALPLGLETGGSLARDGYRLTRIDWRSAPGYYASGYLYEPLDEELGRDARGLRAAVLCPHGHWADGARAPQVQARCTTLARHGYVVLAVDSVHVYDDPIGLAPIGLMTWNNLRGLELLRAREDVDPSRIGCTGASGGGQQTYYLTGLDAGLAAAAPAVMMAHFEEILLSSGVHCGCNFAPFLLEAVDAPLMAAAFAPRPQLFLSVTQDWTHAFPERGLPEIRARYALCGTGDLDERVQSLHLDHPHDYNAAMRAAMYRFFDRWLRGQENGTTREDPGVPLPSPEELAGLQRADLPRDPKAAVASFRERLAYELPALHDREGGEELLPETLARLHAQWGRCFRRGAGEAEGGPALRMGGAVDLGRGWSGNRLSFFTEDPEIEVPGLLLGGEEPASDLVVLLHPRGRAGMLLEEAEWLRALREEGHALLIPDLRYTGELDRAQSWREPYGRIFGADEGRLMTRDLEQVLAALLGAEDLLPRGRRLHLVAFDWTGVAALAARTDGWRLGTRAVVGLGPAYARAADRRPRVAGILRWGDLQELVLAAIPATGRLLVGGADPADFPLLGRKPWPGPEVLQRAPLELETVLSALSRPD